MPNQPDPNLPPNDPTVAPTTLELLLAEIDAACRLLGLELGRLDSNGSSSSSIRSGLGRAATPSPWPA
jgi:hypothetical protein